MKADRRNLWFGWKGRLWGVYLASSFLALQSAGRASPPLERFPLPLYSFDLGSPGSDAVGADSVLVHNGMVPGVAFGAEGLGLGQLYDDLDGLSTAGAGVLPTRPFVLLFSVDRTTVGMVAPDPTLVAAGVPFNAADQAARGHAAGDAFISTTLFTRAGILLTRSGTRAPNNTLAINNFDEGGTDFSAAPPTSARETVPPGTPQDNVDATAEVSTNGVSTNGFQAAGRQPHAVPHLYYSVGANSGSLYCTPDPCLPGDSGADIFFDLDPSLGGNEEIYAYAEQLGLQSNGDDVDGIVVFDLNTNGIFDFPDQVLFSLARGSVSLYQLFVCLPPVICSPADVFSVHFGDPPVRYAAAADLGLDLGDDLDSLDFLYCTDAMDCAVRFGIRAVRGDWSNDGDVDLFDYCGFALCFSGPWDDPNFTTPSELCLFVFDDDHDNDVDLADYRVFQLGFTGPQ
ncbi:MAG: hypothetical protein V2A79_05030 [Planctomycetota bacterium]